MKRLGLIGQGLTATVGAAINTEFSVVVLLDGAPDYRSIIERLRLLPGILCYAATEELLSLIAPRPLLLLDPANRPLEYVTELYRGSTGVDRLQHCAEKEWTPSHSRRRQCQKHQCQQIMVVETARGAQVHVLEQSAGRNYTVSSWQGQSVANLWTEWDSKILMSRGSSCAGADLKGDLEQRGMPLVSKATMPQVSASDSFFPMVSQETGYMHVTLYQSLPWCAGRSKPSARRISPTAT